MASVNPNTINTLGAQVNWQFDVNNGDSANTNTVVTITLPTELSIGAGSFVPVGTLVGNIWTIGAMPANTSYTANIVLDLTTAPATAKTLVLTADVTADFDTSTTNNQILTPLEFILNTPTELCTAQAGESGSAYINVSKDFVACSNGGTATFEFNAEDLVNGTNESWDNTTGEGYFSYIDDSLPITGTYNAYCDGLLCGCDIEFSIAKHLVDKDVYDHTIAQVAGGDLTAEQITTLQAQYPGLVLADYCWNIIINADGDTTSGLPMDCDETIDNNVTVQDVGGLLADGGVVFPGTENGDIHVAVFTDAVSWYKYNGTVWNLVATFQVIHPEYTISDNGTQIFLEKDAVVVSTVTIPGANPYVTGVGVVGTTTKTITLTLSDASTLVTNWTDLDTVPDYTLGGSGLDVELYKDAVLENTHTITLPADPVYTIEIDGNILELYKDAVLIDQVTLPSSAGDGVVSALGVSGTTTKTITLTRTLGLPDVTGDFQVNYSDLIGPPIYALERTGINLDLKKDAVVIDSETLPAYTLERNDPDNIDLKLDGGTIDTVVDPVYSLEKVDDDLIELHKDGVQVSTWDLSTVVDTKQFAVSGYLTTHDRDLVTLGIFEIIFPHTTDQVSDYILNQAAFYTEGLGAGVNPINLEIRNAAATQVATAAIPNNNTVVNIEPGAALDGYFRVSLVDDLDTRINTATRIYVTLFYTQNLGEL